MLLAVASVAPRKIAPEHLNGHRISAVQRAGLRGLTDGEKISYKLVKDHKSGKMSADNLQA
ncbi:hypothetical protein [Rhizobium sullae]|uniref:Uncharacterized protein n=1 Tax=Rhizobium sullae TaxID=50338 RepID=A0A4R3PS36_RHISU|nr:hypothetical protein [Rhizobium sullae]TCU07829.1 hypothetical protein EV132_12856 [Rhizobium sullae]